MKTIASRYLHQSPLATPPPRAPSTLGCCAQWTVALFKAVIGELGRLNAVGLAERGAGKHSRRERAAMARKELADRYRNHCRCC
jgi:hypothetical protein